VGAYPTWRSDVKAVERVSDGPTGVSWVEVNARGERLPLETVESAAPKRLVARIGQGLPFGGTWTYELIPEGAGTRVTITERGEIYNPFYRFFARYVFGYTATMEGYFQALTTKLGS
jgi:Polyketide cyclase / dehydrase and lipid transport